MQNEGVRVADGKRLLLEEKLSPKVTDEVETGLSYTASTASGSPSPQGEGFGGTDISVPYDIIVNT